MNSAGGKNHREPRAWILQLRLLLREAAPWCGKHYTLLDVKLESYVPVQVSACKMFESLWCVIYLIFSFSVWQCRELKWVELSVVVAVFGTVLWQAPSQQYWPKSEGDGSWTVTFLCSNISTCDDTWEAVFCSLLSSFVPPLDETCHLGEDWIAKGVHALLWSLLAKEA